MADAASARDGIIGAEIAHDSAEKHVTGRALYIDDMPEPLGLLHVQLGLSVRAHAKILKLDLDAVRAAPGVIAVFTAADIPGKNDVSPIAGDDVLHLAGVLGGGMNQDVAILAANRHRDLTFKVEMILATHRDPALQAMRRGLQRSGDIAHREGLRRLDGAVGFARSGDVE